MRARAHTGDVHKNLQKHAPWQHQSDSARELLREGERGSSSSSREGEREREKGGRGGREGGRVLRVVEAKRDGTEGG